MYLLHIHLGFRVALGFILFGRLTHRRMPYAVPVRQVGGLPPASFRFHLAVDTLALGYALGATSCARDFHPLDHAHAGHTEKGQLSTSRAAPEQSIRQFIHFRSFRGPSLGRCGLACGAFCVHRAAHFLRPNSLDNRTETHRSFIPHIFSTMRRIFRQISASQTKLFCLDQSRKNRKNQAKKASVFLRRCRRFLCFLHFSLHHPVVVS